jgi:hypothetical protein
VYRWIVGIAVALLLLVVGVGCGGGSGDTTSDITKAQFVKKANAICAEFSKKRAAAAEKEFNSKLADAGKLNSEVKELGEKLLKDSLIPLVKEQQEELESLGAPAGDEEKVEAMMANLGKAIGEMEDAEFQDVVAGDQLDPFEAEAEKYGLKCQII